MPEILHDFRPMHFFRLRSGHLVRRVARARLKIVGAAALALSALACSKSKGGGAMLQHGSGRPAPVTVAPVAQKAEPIQVRAIGTVEALNTVSIVAQVSGEIEKVHFKEGQFVKKGDLLFTIDAAPYVAALRQAQATLARDQAVSTQDDVQATRYAALVKQGLATQEQASGMQATADAAKATLAADRAAVQDARINLAYTSIRSPIQGRTGSLLVQAGNVVKAGDGRALVTIRQVEPIYVQFSVPEQQLTEVRRLMHQGPLDVDASPRNSGAAPDHGVLTFIENTVDTSTGTIDMKARFDNASKRLWPGQFVDVVMRLGVQKDAIVVPSSSVLDGQNGPYAFIVGAGNKAELRLVTVARHIGDEVVVTKGLKPGERVVTDGQVRLSPGALVEITSEPKESATNAPVDPSVVPVTSAAPHAPSARPKLKHGEARR
jgi:membrane fusion protein, multidrug efflux system